MDSGLDSDLGITINGGVIAATGNMYDTISDESLQHFINLSFSEAKKADTFVVVTDENDNPIIAYKSLVEFSNTTLSHEKLVEGKYKVYINGNIEGEIKDGLYSSITSYENGSLQQFTGLNSGFGGGKPRGGENMPERGTLLMG